MLLSFFHKNYARFYESFFEVNTLSTINRLKKFYKMGQEQIPILNIPELTIQTGEQMALTGPSGSGKSTLLHIIGGIVTPDEGEVILNGTNLTEKNEKEKDVYRAEHIGFIFQDFHLIPSLTAEENVRLVLPKKRKETDERIAEWFAKVGLSERRKHRPSELSRGQQQRVAIIRALINNPTLVLADEPTGSLDFETAEHIMDLLLELTSDSDKTLLCITHDRPFLNKFPKVLEISEINEVFERKKVSV